MVMKYTAEIARVQENVKGLEIQWKGTEDTIKKIGDHMTILREKQEESERYSRRWNLRLLNLSESSNEDVRKEVLEIIAEIIPEEKSKLGFMVDTVHRIGHPREDKSTRPVIIQLTMRSFRFKLWRASLNADVMKRKNLRMTEDLTQLERQCRNKLWPLVMTERRQNGRVLLSSLTVIKERKSNGRIFINITKTKTNQEKQFRRFTSISALNEELQCSICLDVFTDPVTTPCGHNFCKTCLNECWKNTQNCSCPFCKETFSKRPDLKINTTLREVVQHFEKKFNLGKSEVLCDFCDERKQKAVKSCLTCQSSYCETHLEPHRRVLGLKKHKLMDAVENLEDYICQKHERPLELFCRDDQTCVCLFCTEGDHKTHNTVPIEDESAEKKNQLVKTQTDVQQMIQNRMKKIQDIQHSVEMRKRNTEEEKSHSVEVFTTLIRSIERCQTEVVEMLEEKQKAAEKQAEDLIKELEQEITELKRRNSELEQISHTEDHLHLLQIDPSLYSPKNSKNWTEISIDTHVSVDTLNTALTRLKDTLHDTVDQKLGQTVLRRMQQYA
ncbi:E3 ubiquitin/ISG15 ligase TRIM25-like, partial [Xyrauchen texanus]|uniref:E3 ubiquitin/ISG15 ligase TRIM25-like n=1 Tax=Xyrauchen texanus TaxID=154827 RepID=UPI002241E730